MDTADLTGGEKVAIVGALLTAIGAFLPWVSAGGLVSVSGIDGDGILTLMFAIGVGAIVAFRDWNRGEKIGIGVLGVLTVLIAANVYGNLSETAGVAIEAEAGGGLHMTLVGGLVLVGAAIQGYRDDTPEQPPGHSQPRQPHPPSGQQQPRQGQPQNTQRTGHQQTRQQRQTATEEPQQRPQHSTQRETTQSE